jgi:uncharacterized protein (DUF1330 family)
VIALVALATVAAPAAPLPPPDPVKCDNRPVIMMVEGTTKDAKRLATYAAAIRASGLYQKLGGYYLVNPRPVAVFEGVSPPERSVIAVHFPCFAHARAFWNSKAYREKIVPLRSNPSAGDFIVTVHMELPVPDYAAAPSSMDGIAQIEKGAK